MIGLVMLFVMFLTLAVLTPTINQYSQTAAGNLTDNAAAVVVRMIPLFMWLGFVITIFIYTQTFRPQ